MLHCKKFVSGINRKFQAYISKSHILHANVTRVTVMRETFVSKNVSIYFSDVSETAGTERKQRFVLFVAGTE